MSRLPSCATGLLAALCLLFTDVVAGQQSTNNNCASATAVTGAAFLPFNTTNDTPDGPIASCQGGQSRDIWYLWTANCTGVAEISTCSTTWDTNLAAYAPGPLCPPTSTDQIACSDLGCGGLQSELVFPCAAGNTYLIQLAGWDATSFGPGNLTFFCSEMVPNDNCAFAHDLIDGVPESYSTLTATPDGPVAGCVGVPSNDIWYTWTAGCSALGSVRTCGSDYDNSVTVFEGTTCPPGPEVACSTVGCGGLQAQALFPVTAGQSYLIQVAGSQGAKGSGEIVAECVLPPPEDLGCFLLIGTPNQAILTWSQSAALPGGYPGGMTIEVSGVATDTIVVSGTATFATYPIAVGTVGQLNICLTGDDGAGLFSSPECCSIEVIGEPNNHCADAIGLTSGVSFDYTTVTSTPDGPAPSCGNGTSPDIWFHWTSECDGDAFVNTCGSNYDTNITVYEAGPTCPTLPEIACSEFGCGALLSEVIFPTFSGQTYLIQVGGWGGAAGEGTITATCTDCGGLGVPDCTFDCATDTVNLAWLDNPLVLSYDLFQNGILLTTLPAGTSSFVVVGAPAGLNEYIIAGTCSLGTGVVVEASCQTFVPAVVVPAPGAGSDLILALETLAPGGPGIIDSSAALEAALLDLGRTPVVFAVPDFDTYPCLNLAEYSVIWVMTGTFGADYRPTSSELESLAGYLAAGFGGVYFEGCDHWGFLHTPSTLDARDGVEEDVGTNIEDGDSSFTAMDGANTGNALLDLGALLAIPYVEDSAASDFNDQLSLSGTTPGAYPDADVAIAEVIWRNHADDPGLTEPDYTVGIVAEHLDGSRMISCSFEFGGVSTVPALRTALAASYLSVLYTRPPPPPPFIRGDTNGDSLLNIADAIFTLGVLFPIASPQTPPCDSALDTNDDGQQDIADAVALLGFLFPTGTPSAIPPPNACGPDPTDDSLTCESFGPCP